MTSRAGGRLSIHGSAAGSRPKARLPTGLLLVFLAGVLGLGCHELDSWAPAPDETSTRSLELEVEKALAALDEAQSSLPDKPAEVGTSLDEARRSLVRLRDFYLPLLQARRRAYSALAWFHLDTRQRCVDELKQVESILLAISDSGDPQLSRELDPPLQTVVAARAAVRAGRTEAPKLIESLGSQLNLLLIKGDLALHGTRLEGG